MGASGFPTGSGNGGSSGAGGAAGGTAGSGTAGTAGSGTAGSATAGASGSSTAGASGSATAGSGTSGSGTCMPQCGGKQCGPDGCQGTCGQCGAQETCTPQGTCVSKCTTTWSVPLTFAPSRLAVDGSTVFVAGKSAQGGVVSARTTCDGAELSAYTGGGAGSSFVSVLATPTELFAVGSTNQDGYVAVLGKSPVASTWEAPLFGSNGLDEVWELAKTPSGNYFLAGVADAGSANEAPWIVAGKNTSTYCGFPPFPGEVGVLRAAITDPSGRVFVGGRKASKALVARYADQDCTAGSCGCSPSVVANDLALGSAWTEIRALAYANGKIFAAGYATDGVMDSFSFLARYDAETLAHEATYQLNGSQTGDAFLSLTVDAGIVYAAGMRGWQGDLTFESATAQIVSISSNFGPGAQPIAIKEPPGAHVAWGIVSSGGALYVPMTAATYVLAKM